MSTNARRVLCGEASLLPGAGSDLRIPLGVEGRSLDFSPTNLRPHYGRPLTDAWLDLLTIGGFVFAADGAVARPERRGLDLDGKDWGREFRLVIPVRCPEAWEAHESLLSEVLGSMTGDSFGFEFRKVKDPAPRSLPLFDGTVAPTTAQPRVLLVSGGLDSATRLVECATEGTAPTIAVTLGGRGRHDGPRDRLLEAVRCGLDFDRRKLVTDVFLPCRRHGCDAELTARTRPFLIFALAGATAWAVGASAFEVPENGIVAANLPLAGDVTGNRASRTAHPETRVLMREVFEKALDYAVQIRNTFDELTRREVIERLATAKRLELVAATISCSRANPGKRRTPHPDEWYVSSESADPPSDPPQKDHETAPTHCGRCTQCVDRRVAILLGGWERYDPVEAYAVDPINGNGGPPRDAAGLQDYAVTAVRWATTASSREFTRVFSRAGSQLADAIEGSATLWECPREEAGQRLWELHRRHGLAVAQLCADEHIAKWRKALFGGAYSDSLVVLVGRSLGRSGVEGEVVPGSVAALAYRGEWGRWRTVELDDHAITELLAEEPVAHPILDTRDKGLRRWAESGWLTLDRGRGGHHHFLAAIIRALPRSSVLAIRSFMPNNPSPNSIDKVFRELKARLDGQGAPLTDSLHRNGTPSACDYRFAPSSWTVVLLLPKRSHEGDDS